MSEELVLRESWGGAAARGLEARTEREKIIASVLKPTHDFGVIPGTNKPTLLKAGAEKIADSLNCYADYEAITAVEDWDKPLFYYVYRARLIHRATGNLIAEAEGSANSMEARYRWRWVPEHQIPANLDKATLLTQGGRSFEFGFAIDKAETGGKYGKPAAYWQAFRAAIENGTATPVTKTSKGGKALTGFEIDATQYRVPNDDIFTLINTLQKMSQKRAKVAVVLVGTNASDVMTQDLEDMDTSQIATAPPPTRQQAEPPEPPAEQPKPTRQRRRTTTEEEPPPPPLPQDQTIEGTATEIADPPIPWDDVKMAFMAAGMTKAGTELQDHAIELWQLRHLNLGQVRLEFSGLKQQFANEPGQALADVNDMLKEARAAQQQPLL